VLTQITARPHGHWPDPARSGQYLDFTGTTIQGDAVALPVSRTRTSHAIPPPPSAHGQFEADVATGDLT
jgi:hypothetical protein